MEIIVNIVRMERAAFFQNAVAMQREQHLMDTFVLLALGAPKGRMATALVWEMEFTWRKQTHAMIAQPTGSFEQFLDWWDDCIRWFAEIVLEKRVNQLNN